MDRACGNRAWKQRVETTPCRPFHRRRRSNETAPTLSPAVACGSPQTAALHPSPLFSPQAPPSPTRPPTSPATTTDDLRRLEDVGFMTCMTLVLMGNYSQTGHFGGPLAYTPYN